MFSWNRLPQGVKAIFFVQIVNRLGDFVVPFLSLILTQIQGLEPVQAGLVVTLSTALGSFGGLVAGKLSDSHSRRDVLFVFLGTSGILLGAAGFAPAHLLALVAMVAGGFFLGAMRPVLNALVADLAPSDLRREAFSLSYLGINLGVAVGPLMAGWFFAHALPWMFWLDALSTACALGILVRWVPRQTAVRVVEAEGPGPGNSLKAFVRHPLLGPFAVLAFLYNLLYAQLLFSQSLQLVDLFGVAGAGVYGVVWGVNGLTCILLTPVAMKLTSGWTNLRSMTWGMVFVALGLSVFLLHPNEALVIAGAVLWTTGEVLLSIHMGDLVAGQSPPDLRGRFQGYMAFVSSLAYAVAPLVGGTVAQYLGLGAVWWSGVVVILGVGLGFTVLERRSRG